MTFSLEILFSQMQIIVQMLPQKNACDMIQYLVVEMAHGILFHSVFSLRFPQRLVAKSMRKSALNLLLDPLAECPGHHDFVGIAFLFVPKWATQTRLEVDNSSQSTN